MASSQMPESNPAVPPELVGLELHKLRYDLYKVRAEEFRVRYESMRELEWKILFQMYTGYAAIGVVYDHLKASSVPMMTCWVAVVATIGFYVAGRYLTFRIQERMIGFAHVRLAYLERMHAMLGVEESPVPSLGHRYHWSYQTQLIVSTFVMLSLIGYEATFGLTKFWTPVHVVVVTILGLFFACASLGLWGWKLDTAPGRKP